MLSPAAVLLILRLALALLLYLFLGALLLALRSEKWDDRPQLPEAFLQIRQGSQAGQLFRLADENSIGRSAENQIYLNQDGVSARHARLFFQDNGWWLEDLGSNQGTWVNAARIDRRVRLAEGDQLQVGSVQLDLLHRSPASR